MIHVAFKITCDSCGTRILLIRGLGCRGPVGYRCGRCTAEQPIYGINELYALPAREWTREVVR